MSNASIEECKEMWISCFHDSAEYTDFYFSHKREGSLGYFNRENNKLASMLFANPYQTIFFNTSVLSHFVVGVATRPEFRGQGRMRNLLTKVMTDLAASHEPFIYLQPASEAIYQPFDFRGIYYRDKKKTFRTLFIRDRLNGRAKKFCDCSEKQKQKVVDFANAWHKSHFDLYVKRDIDYYEMLEAELNMVSGRVIVGFDGENVSYVCHYFTFFHRTEVIEFIGDETKLGKVKTNTQKADIMLRILDLQSFLEILPAQVLQQAGFSAQGHLNITDDIVLMNNIEIPWAYGQEQNMSIASFEEKIYPFIRTGINDIT